MTDTVVTDRLKEILSRSFADTIILETFEISHSQFLETKYLLRNYLPGGSVQVTLEDDSQQTFLYVPTRLDRATQQGNLNQRFDITFQDLNEIIQEEEERIQPDDREKPIIRIRSFEYSKRTRTVNALIEGPYDLEVGLITYNELGARISAAPRNTSQPNSGRVMTTLAVQSLRGFTR